MYKRQSLNHTTSTYGQLLTLSHAKARDRVASVLVRLDAMLGREEDCGHVLPIAHGDVAFIASLRRTTVSCELKALAEEGMLHLGYRRIELLESFIEEYGSLVLSLIHICWLGLAAATLAFRRKTTMI